MGTSLNGWPAPPEKLKVFKIPNCNRRLTLDKDAGRLLTALAADYHETVRPLDIGPTDEGGYAYREAMGAAGRLSNHASGTAIDLNWREEGAQGSKIGALFFNKVKNRKAINAIKSRYGRWVDWGGDWRAKEYMHWEIKPGVNRVMVLNACKQLGINANGVRTTPSA